MLSGLFSYAFDYIWIDLWTAAVLNVFYLGRQKLTIWSSATIACMTYEQSLRQNIKLQGINSRKTVVRPSQDLSPTSYCFYHDEFISSNVVLKIYVGNKSAFLVLFHFLGRFNSFEKFTDFDAYIYRSIAFQEIFCWDHAERLHVSYCVREVLYVQQDSKALQHLTEKHKALINL